MGVGVDVVRPYRAISETCRLRASKVLNHVACLGTFLEWSGLCRELRVSDLLWYLSHATNFRPRREGTIA
jgi:hypothetical protein